MLLWPGGISQITALHVGTKPMCGLCTASKTRVTRSSKEQSLQTPVAPKPRAFLLSPSASACLAHTLEEGTADVPAA